MIYVLADIHGRADRYHEILKSISFSADDTLYVLGDVIDRNPDGILILEEIISADNIHMLLGNHEYMMLNAIENPSFQINQRVNNLDLWYLNGGEITELAYKALPDERKERILNFIRELPLNIEVFCENKRYILAHGSPVTKYRPEYTHYRDEKEYAVWNRFDPQNEEFGQDTTLICGHTPTIYLYPTFPMKVYRINNMLFIDCGCAYSKEEGGRLSCLCLNTGEVKYSAL